MTDEQHREDNYGNLNPSWNSKFDHLWMVFMSLILCSVFFGQKIFKNAFPRNSQYIYLIVVWLIIIILIYWVGSRISIKSIHIILLICSLISAFVWLYYSAALPAKDASILECETWDCRLLQDLEMGTMINNWATGWLGQSLIIFTLFTIMPPLFLILYSKQRRGSKTLFNPTSLLILGCILVIIGLVELLLPSYIAMLMVSLTHLLLIGFIITFPINKSNVEKNDETLVSENHISFNFWNFFKNILALAAIIVFCFSFTDPNYYIFEHLFEMGIGVMILYLWNKVILPNYAKSNIDKIWWNDFFFFSSMVVAMSMGWHFYNSGSELTGTSGISSIISGIFFGYLSIRLNFYVKNPNPIIGKSINLKFLKRPYIDFFILNIVIFLIFVGALIEIIPRNNDAFLTFIPGLLIALIGYFLVVSQKLLRKSNISSI